MAMRLVQYDDRGRLTVALVGADGTLEPLAIEGGTHALAQAAIAEGGMAAAIEARRGGARVAYDEVAQAGMLLPPLTHPDQARCLVSGTGLTHLGSADTRESMHVPLEAGASDSMKMFRMGLEGGKPPAGQVGAQPEWFYKGDGACVVAPGAPLGLPDFAEDGGEEPELVGLYVIGPDHTPYRLGFAIGNEYSDHVTERVNYLWLAHSKLRDCAFGPELRIGPAPEDIRGTSSIRRGGQVIWSRPFATGAANMSHSLANLEHHHFKYPGHRRPGDVHVHFFGTAVLSFADQVRIEPGDVMAIAAEGFGRALENPLGMRQHAEASVRAL